MNSITKSNNDRPLDEKIKEIRQRMRLNRIKQEEAFVFDKKFHFFITKINQSVALFNEITLNNDDPAIFQKNQIEAYGFLFRISEHLRTFFITVYLSKNPNKLIDKAIYESIDIYWNMYDAAFERYLKYCKNYPKKSTD